MTYDLLDSTTLGTTAASVTFSAISQDYRDLIVVFSGTGGGSLTKINFNGDTGSNYSAVTAEGDGSSVRSLAFTSNTMFTANWGPTLNSTNIGNTIWQIMDYSATDKHKSVLIRGNLGVSGSATMTAGRWANTAAITSVVVAPDSGSFNSGSTFYLYGIAS